ncbi:MAG: class I SAM-dependent methyltransferase [Thermoanaerobaculia bacterium]|nr:class I SAM-dependent methyltransferase [Thermoanaerobaculia bacterium]
MVGNPFSRSSSKPGEPAPSRSLLQAVAADPLLDAIGRQLLRLDSGLGLFRLVHLLDAISRSPVPRPRSIISVGSGEGLHEAFLARLFPEASVLGIDLRTHQVGFTLANLSFRQGDLLDPVFAASLPRAEFVCSIECLEHIDDDQRMAESMGSLVLPGGALYIQVPFASEADLSDPAVVREHLEANEHVRPGYHGAGLAALCRRAGVRVEHLAGAFWFPMQPMVWFTLEHFGTDLVLPYWLEFFELALRDVRDGVPEHRMHSTAIKVLAVNDGPA